MNILIAALAIWGAVSLIVTALGVAVSCGRCHDDDTDDDGVCW